MHDRLRQQPARHKRQHLCRGSVEPLCVVDRAQQRALLRCLREQAQGRQANEEEIRARPSRSPNVVSSASRCGAGIRSKRSSSGADSRCSAAYANSISDSTPTARTTINPDADSIACSSSVVFPTPASPRSTRTPLCPVPSLVEQPIEHRALAVPPTEHQPLGSWMAAGHQNGHPRPTLPKCLWPGQWITSSP